MIGRLSASQRAEARALYLSDPALSVDAVAARYGVGRSVMLNVLKGITRPKGGRLKSSMSTDTMIRMRDDGVTYYQIAKQAGLSESGVFRRIERHQEKASA